MNIDHLFQLTGPHQHLLTATPSQTWDFARSLERDRPAVVRVLRGSKTQTVPALFDEFAAALQFPLYFGENWNALDECLSDLEWLPGDSYVLLFADAPKLLACEPAETLALLLNVLESAAQEWSAKERGDWKVPSRPFHVVFQCAAADATAFLARAAACGRTLKRLSWDDAALGLD